jgi:hypothetical protein
MNMADPIKRISDSRTQQYWTSISSSISNTTQRLRVNIFNPPLPPSVVEKTIEVSIPFKKRNKSKSNFSIYSMNVQY